MPDYIITISVIEKKIMEAFGIDIQDWAKNALFNKVRKCGDQAIRILSQYRPETMSMEQKINLLITLNNTYDIQPGDLKDGVNPYLTKTMIT